MLILAMIAFGMFCGWLAQLVLGQKFDRINWPLTLGAGVAGSFVAGTVSSMLGSEGFRLRPAGLIGSFLGAVVVTIGWQMYQRRKRS